MAAKPAKTAKSAAKKAMGPSSGMMGGFRKGSLACASCGGSGMKGGKACAACKGSGKK